MIKLKDLVKEIIIPVKPDGSFNTAGSGAPDAVIIMMRQIVSKCQEEGRNPESLQILSANDLGNIFGPTVQDIVFDEWWGILDKGVHFVLVYTLEKWSLIIPGVRVIELDSIGKIQGVIQDIVTELPKVEGATPIKPKEISDVVNSIEAEARVQGKNGKGILVLSPNDMDRVMTRFPMFAQILGERDKDAWMILTTRLGAALLFEPSRKMFYYVTADEKVNFKSTETYKINKAVGKIVKLLPPL